jgi:hypothetical protein
MPRSRKINREKVLALLDKTCPKCGFTITPDPVKRVDSIWSNARNAARNFSPGAKDTFARRLSF